MLSFSVLNSALESVFSKNLPSLCAEFAFRVHGNVTTFIDNDFGKQCNVPLKFRRVRNVNKTAEVFDVY